jgi:hypothetical protein
MPAGKLIPVRIGDVDVYIETMPPVPLVGSEQTAFGRQRPQEGEAVEKVADVFARAQDAILSIATTTASVLEKAAKAAVHPETLEVEFGIAFSAEGHIVIAKATAEASLKVTLTYTKAKPGVPALPTTP